MSEAIEGGGIPGCGICGGFRVSIRGRVPGDDSRIVCPTCFADRMDQIREVSAPEYGQAFASNTDPLIPAPEASAE